MMNFKNNIDYDNYTWVAVGNYSGLSNEQELEFEPDFEKTMTDYPPSVCSDPCDTGQVHIT